MIWIIYLLINHVWEHNSGNVNAISLVFNFFFKLSHLYPAEESA